MTENIIFVIGAGASREVGLPTGNELKDKISELLNIKFGTFESDILSGDHKIVQALKSHISKTNSLLNEFIQAAWNIKSGLPLARSIDEFIDSHRGNKKIALCGKLAIVKAILDAERQSLLYFENFKGNSNIDFISLEKENKWYVPFYKLITDNCQKNDLKEKFSSITLIIFNYDRCIEHFLYHALQTHYNISQQEASSIVDFINIYHPYGDVGKLSSVKFGDQPCSKLLLDLAQNNIKTFTEGTNQISEIREHMSMADKLVFLGFAFYKPNMELIKPDKATKKKYPRCFATTYEMSDSNQHVIKARICQLYHMHIMHANIKMANKCCGDFFTEFGMSLTF